MYEVFETQTPAPEFDMKEGNCRRQPWLQPLFFAFGNTLEGKRDVQEAKSICRDCPIKQECGDYALDNAPVEGIWGGMTLADRQLIRSERFNAQKDPNRNYGGHPKPTKENAA